MRYLTTAMMALVLTLSVLSSKAFAELTPQEQLLADMMLSGDMTQLRAASKQIYSAKIANPELLDIAAAIMLKKYPQATRSEVDPLAWVARAIGASENGRYYSVLSEVVEKTTLDKLERHADKALDDLPGAEGEQFAYGMYMLPEKLYSKELDSSVISRLKSQMTAGDLSNLKQAAKEMTSRELKSQALCDIAAEILLRNYASAQKNQLDTFAWLMNAIGRSGMARYHDVLLEVEENSETRKLRRYAESNREALNEETAEQYKLGMFDEPLPDYAF